MHAVTHEILVRAQDRSQKIPPSVSRVSNEGSEWANKMWTAPMKTYPFSCPNGIANKNMVAVISVLCIFFLTPLCASGCGKAVNGGDQASTVTRMMGSWVGHYESELLAAWGPPTSTGPDGKGGKVVTYESLMGTWGNEKDKRIVGGAHYSTKPRQPGYAATRVFYVNEKGIIYSWKWSGL